MDPELLSLLFGGIPGMTGGMPGAAIPPAAPIVAPPPPPVVAPAAPQMMAGPPAPMVAPQGFEMTNTGNPRMPAPGEDYRTQSMNPVPAPDYASWAPGAGAGPTSLGAALEPAGVPMPRPRPAEAGPGANQLPAAAPGGDALLKTLRGVQAPAAPTPQKVSTPHAPQIAKIQGGALADLLASLGIGPQQALPGLKLPSTLGQALGGR